MPALPVLRLTAGLIVSPLEATPDHCVDAVNVFSYRGRLLKRSGMRHRQSCVGLATTPYVGFSDGSSGTAEPVSTVNTGVISAPASQGLAFYGANTPFNRITVHTRQDNMETPDSNWVDLKQQSVQYWNGSAWADAQATIIHHGSRLGTDIYGTNVFNNRDTSGSATATSTVLDSYEIVFSTPSAWATKSITGKSKFWIRHGTFQFMSTYHAAIDADLTTVNCTDNRVLHINSFEDRDGRKHTFVAYLFGDDGRELRFSIDGVVTTQSANLQPDGSATAATGSRQFSQHTKIWSAYAPATDRLVGYIVDFGWFYLIPSEVYTNSSGALAANIYSLVPGDGTDTPYQSLIGGLRGAMPRGDVVIQADGRFFAFDGSFVRYSAPGFYIDLWGNDFELLLGDDKGNITGACQVGGVIVAFKRNAIWVMQSDGTADGYTAFPIPGNVGCVAPRSIAVAGSVAYFLAEDGVYSFDGQNLSRVSGAIDQLITSSGFSSKATNAVGVYLSSWDQYRLFFQSPDSSDIYDSALYLDLYGHTVRTQGVETQEVSWWPQGKYQASDYGFNATEIAVSSTSNNNEMLIGDRYGMVWQADAGTRDAGTVVGAHFLSARIGLGSMRKALVRWAAVSLGQCGNHDVTLLVRPEGREDLDQSATVSPVRGFTLDDEGPTFEPDEEFTDGTVFAVTPDEAVVQNSYAVMGRWFQLEILALTDSKWECDGIEVEVNTYGRRQ